MRSISAKVAFAGLVSLHILVLVTLTSCGGDESAESQASGATAQNGGQAGFREREREFRRARQSSILGRCGSGRTSTAEDRSGDLTSPAGESVLRHRPEVDIESVTLRAGRGGAFCMTLRLAGSPTSRAGYLFRAFQDDVPVTYAFKPGDGGSSGKGRITDVATGRSVPGAVLARGDDLIVAVPVPELLVTDEPFNYRVGAQLPGVADALPPASDNQLLAYPSGEVVDAPPPR